MLQWYVPCLLGSFWEPWKRRKIVCEIKLLFTIAYIQYTIGLQLYLLKRNIDKELKMVFKLSKFLVMLKNEQ